MELEEMVKVTPYEEYYQLVELFAQPSIVTDAHSRIQLHLQKVCNKHSINLHTGVYQLSPGELPDGSWTLARMPGALSKGSCLMTCAHQDSAFL